VKKLLLVNGGTTEEQLLLLRLNVVSGAFGGYSSLSCQGSSGKYQWGLTSRLLLLELSGLLKGHQLDGGDWKNRWLLLFLLEDEFLLLL
jgi:hypothetical protein